MANWNSTRKADVVVSLINGNSGWSGSPGDPHPPFGNEAGTTDLARIEVKFPRPTLPASGVLVKALVTYNESGTNSHPGYDGNSPRLELRRINEKPDREKPSTTASSNTVTASLNGAETHSIRDMVEEMLPSSIKRASDPSQGCGGLLYGWIQIRSSDETDSNKSGIVTDDWTLYLEIKDDVTPGAPIVQSIAGAQDDPTDSSRTIVASTDGRTLDVTYAFSGAAGDYPAKVELALFQLGATDGTSGNVIGTVIRTTGNIAAGAALSTGIYRARLTSLPLATEGVFAIRTTSNKGEQGPWSSVEDTGAHILLAVLPGPPLDIVFQPTTDHPHVGFSLDSPSVTDFLTGQQAEVTLLPQGGPPIFDSGMEDLTGNSRRADVTVQQDFPDGQSVSFRVRTKNALGVVGAWSAPQTAGPLREAQQPTVTSSTGLTRLLSRTPTLTVHSPTADGYRLRLVDANDPDRELYDSGGITVTNLTSRAFVIPAGILTWGQHFLAVPSYLPDGTLTYLPDADPTPFSIAGLPTVALSVPDAVNGKVATTDPVWLRQYADPDGAAAARIDHEIRQAATPQGTGALIVRFVDEVGVFLRTVPGGTFPFETAVDSRVRATNDITALVASTLSASAAVGATSVTLASTSGLVVGQDLSLASTVAGQIEIRAIDSLPGGNVVTFLLPLRFAHASGQSAAVSVWGPWSSWVTITALQPPTVDLLAPANSVVVTDPTELLQWSSTYYGSRTTVSAVAAIYVEASGTLMTEIDAGTASQVLIPSFLLDTLGSYSWDVLVTDSEGMATRSAQRTFSTSFADPLPITVLLADTDPDAGSVILTWDNGPEPFPDNYEVTWLADDGSPVRIDGGPAGLLDGGVPFIGGTLTHIGARLGVNVYHVAVSNGWRSSEPVSVSVTLTRGDSPLSWVAVDGSDLAVGLQVNQADEPHQTMAERMQAPGGQPRQITWGAEPRAWTVSITTVPGEDRALVPVLREWMETGTGFWMKAPAGYGLDPLWATLQSFDPTPVVGGLLTAGLSMLELGDPVHSILPEPASTGGGSAGNIYATVDEIDFGTFILP